LPTASPFAAHAKKQNQNGNFLKKRGWWLTERDQVSADVASVEKGSEKMDHNSHHQEDHPGYFRRESHVDDTKNCCLLG
jgi:hypothetical protein